LNLTKIIPPSQKRSENISPSHKKGVTEEHITTVSTGTTVGKHSSVRSVHAPSISKGAASVVSVIITVKNMSLTFVPDEVNHHTFAMAVPIGTIYAPLKSISTSLLMHKKNTSFLYVNPAQA
jgi:hypothetical protein